MTAKPFGTLEAGMVLDWMTVVQRVNVVVSINVDLFDPFVA